MRGVALAMIGLIWSAAGAAIAAPAPGGATGAKRPDISLPLEGVVTNPDWIEKPDGADFATYFPRVAQLLNLSGHAAIRCEVSTTGSLENCSVIQEQPPGMGFGEAAVKISQFFRMKPMSVDGAPMAGGIINIPITFAVPQLPDPGPAPADPAPPSAKAMELARRVAATNFGPTEMQAYVGMIRRSVVGQFGAGLTEQQQAAIDGYMQAVVDSGPQRVEATARVYAHEFTEAQLAEIAAFLESSTGQAWMARNVSSSAETQAENARIQRALTIEARSRFCSKYDCLKIDAPSPAAAAKQ